MLLYPVKSSLGLLQQEWEQMEGTCTNPGLLCGHIPEFHLHFVLQKSKAGKGLQVFNVYLQYGSLEEAKTLQKCSKWKYRYPNLQTTHLRLCFRQHEQDLYLMFSESASTLPYIATTVGIATTVHVEGV